MIGSSRSVEGVSTARRSSGWSASCAAALLLLLAAQAQAETSAQAAQRATSAAASAATPEGLEGLEDYLTIDSISVKPTARGWLSRNEALELGLLAAPSPGAMGGGILGDVVGSIIDGLSDPSKWVALGQKAWEIVQAGKPVANVTTMRVSVMPVSESDWAQMENWRGPMSQGYSIVAKNLFGMTVVQLDYRVIYNYGGSLNGKGAYLANTTVLPTKVDVLWGFTVDASVEAQRVVNMGSATSPVPGLEMTVHYVLSSALKRSEGRESFFVTGNGETTRLTR